MRRGYWIILLRRMRDRVASGYQVFPFADTRFVIARICADEEALRDEIGEIVLAADAEGRTLLLKVSDASLSVLPGLAGERIATGADFPAMIAALEILPAGEGQLGTAIDDTLLPQRSARRNRLFDDE